MKPTSSSDYQRELREILENFDGWTSYEDTIQAILDLNERAFDASTSFINAQSILSKPIKESDNDHQQLRREDS